MQSQRTERAKKPGSPILNAALAGLALLLPGQASAFGGSQPSPAPQPPASGGPRCGQVTRPAFRSCLSWAPVDCQADLLKEAKGFGRGAVGGKGAELYRVTSLEDDDVPGTLRYGAGRAGAAWIVFDVSGTIVLKDSLKVASDKTIDGRGASVTVTGEAISIAETSQNVIVTDLRFDGSPSDGLNIMGSAKRVWIHQCSFANAGDGLLDIKGNATNITLSWNVFGPQAERSMLIAAGDGGLGGRVTLHHNHWKGGASRLPKIGDYWVHLQNNFYDGTEGNHDVTCDGRCQLLAESNYYLPARSGGVAMVSEKSSEGIQGLLKASGNLLKNGARIAQHRASEVFVPANFYPLPPEAAGDALACRVRALAGPRR